MKTYFAGFLALTSALSLLTGCSESSNSGAAGGSTPPAPQAPPAPPVAAVAETAKKVGAEAVQAVEAAKPQVQEAAKVVQQAVTDAGAAAQQKFNDLVAQVKKLIAEGKGTEAVQALTSATSALKLSPEQQKTLDDLKAQAQAALSKKGAEAATKAVGDLLKPKTGN